MDAFCFLDSLDAVGFVAFWMHLPCKAKLCIVSYSSSLVVHVDGYSCQYRLQCWHLQLWFQPHRVLSIQMVLGEVALSCIEVMMLRIIDISSCSGRLHGLEPATCVGWCRRCNHGSRLLFSKVFDRLCHTNRNSSKLCPCHVSDPTIVYMVESYSQFVIHTTPFTECVQRC